MNRTENTHVFHEFCKQVFREKLLTILKLHFQQVVAAQRQASFVMSELSKSTEGFQVVFEDMPEEPYLELMCSMLWVTEGFCGAYQGVCLVAKTQ